MRLNRTLLYTGVFLAAIGVALIVIDTGSPDSHELISALGLWPLVPIATGLALVLRRTPLSLVSGLLAAIVPGLALGGILALGTQLAVDRGYLHVLGAAYQRVEDPCAVVGARFDIGHVEMDPFGGCP